ncbi:class I SAM-dependent methyltransferase [Myxococcota bacterium]|nr:class I SAM-dependent methyltransferase [Myxococcota bacterium]
MPSLPMPSPASEQDRRPALGDESRVGLFLFGADDPDVLRQCLSEIPEAVEDWLGEIVVMLAEPQSVEGLESQAQSILGGRPFRLRFQPPPRSSRWGELRKAAFEIALVRSIDHVVVMQVNGSQPALSLEAIRAAVQRDPEHVLLVTRGRRGRAGARLRHGLMAALQNRILGLRIRDYATPLRVYPSEVLRRIPFQLDADHEQLEAEVLIQCRCLGVPVEELRVLDAAPGDGSGQDDWLSGWRACATAVGLRLHQAHLTRDGRYLVDHDIHYTLKSSSTGSHMQIVDAIAPESEVLDLGCSQGLLARPLSEKGVRVTGVDRGVGEQLADELAEYHTRDLEEPLELPVGRIFDYVVCADVIEHVQNRAQLLRGARRHLKKDGRLIISTPNIALWFYRLSLLVGRFEYGPRGVLDETHVHLFTRSTFRREVERAGFQVLKQRVTALPFEVVFHSTGRSRLVRGLAEGYHALARFWPSLFAYQFILEAEIMTLDDDSEEVGDLVDAG